MIIYDLIDVFLSTVSYLDKAERTIKLSVSKTTVEDESAKPVEDEVSVDQKLSSRHSRGNKGGAGRRGKKQELQPLGIPMADKPDAG